MALEHLLVAALWMATASEPVGTPSAAEPRVPAPAASQERPGLLARIRSRLFISRRGRADAPNAADQPRAGQGVTPASLETPEMPATPERAEPPRFGLFSNRPPRPSTAADPRTERKPLLSQLRNVFSDHKRDTPRSSPQTVTSAERPAATQQLLAFETEVGSAPAQAEPPSGDALWDNPVPVKTRPQPIARVIKRHADEQPLEADAPAHADTKKVGGADPDRAVSDSADGDPTAAGNADAAEAVEALPEGDSIGQPEEPGAAGESPSDAEQEAPAEDDLSGSEESASRNSDPLARLLARVSQRSVRPAKAALPGDSSGTRPEPSARPIEATAEPERPELLLANLATDATDPIDPTNPDGGAIPPLDESAEPAEAAAASAAAEMVVVTEASPSRPWAAAQPSARPEDAEQGDIAAAAFQASPSAPTRSRLNIPHVSAAPRVKPQEKPARPAFAAVSAAKLPAATSIPAPVQENLIASAAPVVVAENEPAEPLASEPAEPPASELAKQNPQSRPSAVAALGTLRGVPLEYYPAIVLLLIGIGSVLLSRWRRGERSEASSIPAHAAGPPTPPNWSAGMAMEGGYAGETARANRAPSLFGAFTTAIGLAIVAVGVTAIARAQLGQEIELFRPGMVVAAGGQFVLLIGIMALAFHSIQKTRARHAAQARGLHSAFSGLNPALAPVMVGGAWATPSPVAAHASRGTGQIAQLKAQLASLSQQLDHLPPAQ